MRQRMGLCIQAQYNVQVKELYGPLLAVVTASKSAFDAMVRQHSPGEAIDGFITAAREHPEGKEGQVYRCYPC